MKLKDYTKGIDATMNLYQFGRCIYKGTDCGPWIVAVLPCGKEIYYSDGEDISPETEIDYLIAGSIVEGSDYEVGPYYIQKPQELWNTIDEIDFEAKCEWEIANGEELD